MSDQETRVTKVTPVQADSATGEACLVQIYPSGPEMGRRFPIDGATLTIGRDPGNGIVLDYLDNVSRRHCEFANAGGKVFLQDLGSTNGTYLNDNEIKGQVELRSGDLVKVGSAIFKFLYGGNVEAQYHEEIYRMTIIDGLTQVYNKRYFLEFLEREMARCHRYARALSMLMFDIDHFKHINDEFGHLAGDYVLRELAGLVRTRVRREECIARYGGEEFAVVLPESGPEKVRIFGDKLLKMVAGHPFTFEGRPIKVTISIGVADMTYEITDPVQFIKVADTQLYRAKHEGRNRMCG